MASSRSEPKGSAPGPVATAPSMGPEAEAQRKENERRVAQIKAKKEAEAAVKAAEKEKRKVARVAAGKSITCARGVIAEGQPVTARDFCKFEEDLDEGQARLNDLAGKGYIVPASKDDAKK